MTMQPHLVRQAVLLEMEHGMRVHFSVLSEGGCLCSFKQAESTKSEISREGTDEDDAFKNTLDAFLKAKKSESKSEKTNKDLRKRVRDLESRLETQSAAVDASSNGRDPETDQEDDAIGGTI